MASRDVLYAGNSLYTKVLLWDVFSRGCFVQEDVLFVGCSLYARFSWDVSSMGCSLHAKFSSWDVFLNELFTLRDVLFMGCFLSRRWMIFVSRTYVFAIGRLS